MMLRKVTINEVDEGNLIYFTYVICFSIVCVVLLPLKLGQVKIPGGKSDFNVTFPLGNQRKSLSSTTSQYHDQTQEHEFVCFYAMSAHKNHFKKQKYGTESV